MWPFLRGLHERPNLQTDLVLGTTIASRVHVPFLLLSNQSDVRFRLAVALRFTRVFRPVKNQYLSRRAFGGNQVGVLRHISRLVDFSRVNYLLNNLDFRRRGDGVATHFSSFVVPVEGSIAFGEVD